MVTSPSKSGHFIFNNKSLYLTTLKVNIKSKSTRIQYKNTNKTRWTQVEDRDQWRIIPVSKTYQRRSASVFDTEEAGNEAEIKAKPLPYHHDSHRGNHISSSSGLR